MGSPRAPANLPEWSWNDLDFFFFLESRSVNIFDFDVFCHLLQVLAVFRKCLIKEMDFGGFCFLRCRNTGKHTDVWNQQQSCHDFHEPLAK